MEEKKIIKNYFRYCKLTLFYTPTILHPEFSRQIMHCISTHYKCVKIINDTKIYIYYLELFKIAESAIIR